jgi:hypothetical protein
VRETVPETEQHCESEIEAAKSSILETPKSNNQHSGKHQYPSINHFFGI